MRVFHPLVPQGSEGTILFWYADMAVVQVGLMIISLDHMNLRALAK